MSTTTGRLITDNGTHGVLDAGDVVDNFNDDGVGASRKLTVSTRLEKLLHPVWPVTGCLDQWLARQRSTMRSPAPILAEPSTCCRAPISKPSQSQKSYPAWRRTRHDHDYSGRLRVGSALATLGGTTMILIDANNVTVQNLTVDGDNPGFQRSAIGAPT